MPSNVEAGIVFEQPKTFSDRQSVAAQCCESMQLTMPCVVDEIENNVDQVYAGWPERMFVVDAAGRIAYAGKQGPWGFKPAEVERWLKKNVGAPTSKRSRR
jgi:hypothetical protein